MALVRNSRLANRAILENIIRLIPAVVITAVMLNALSCKGGGFSSSNSSPFVTPTPGAGALAFVTNFADANVSSFTRNINTGGLKHTGQVMAGAKKGPRGVVASPSGSFLYVANKADDNIYEFSISPTNGTLTPLSPAFVSNGNATQPDELAINTAGTLMWVTGGAATVTWYKVNSSTGQITRGSSIDGFNTPFGIAVNPSSLFSVLYVGDAGTGLIWPMTFNSTTGALQKNFSAVHSPDVGANTPGLIAIDAGFVSLFVPDQVTGEVSSFAINTATGGLTPIGVFPNASPSNGRLPVGIGIAINNANEFLFTANQGSGIVGTVSSFLVSPAGGQTLIVPPTVAGPYNGPLGLVVDPQNKFVYTADNTDGTVAQSIINGSCGSSICVGPTVSTEKPPNAKSQPFGITLAQ